MLSEVKEVPARERAGEYLLLRLRTPGGLLREEYEKQYQLPFDPIEAYLQQCRNRGHAVQTEGGRWHLTPQGFLLSNSIISDLLLIQDQSVPLAKRR